MSVRDFRDQSLTNGSAAVGPRELGIRPEFIEKHEPLGVEAELSDSPFRPPLRDIGPILLGGVDHFFFQESFSAASAFERVD